MRKSYGIHVFVVGNRVRLSIQEEGAEGALVVELGADEGDELSRLLTEAVERCRALRVN